MKLNGFCDSGFWEAQKTVKILVHYFCMDKVPFARLDVRESQLWRFINEGRLFFLRGRSMHSYSHWADHTHSDTHRRLTVALIVKHTRWLWLLIVLLYSVQLGLICLKATLHGYLVHALNVSPTFHTLETRLPRTYRTLYSSFFVPLIFHPHRHCEFSKPEL